MIKRIFLEPNRLSDPIYTKINDFLAINCDKRITEESRAYYRNPKTLGLAVLYFVKVKNTEVLIGLSASNIEPEVTNSITVVSFDFRNLGIGSDLLKEKVRLLPDFHTLVASDNLASIKSCLKAGLVKVAESTGKRKSGEYQIHHFSKLHILPKEELEPGIGDMIEEMRQIELSHLWGG